MIAWNNNNPDKVKESSTKWKSNNNDKVYKYHKEWKINNKDKYLAQKKVQNRIHRGVIEKPDYCQMCGRECFIHGHHADYSKPLDIIWICPKCHYNIHSNRAGQP